MAILKNRALFFTTSPRTPSKMLPEIDLLYRHFSEQKWDSKTQIEFIDALASSDFFEGLGSPNNKAFSARDRINRAPKALGFVDLKPKIQITEAGKEFILGKRPQEIFLRQILKFQLPSPYHIESNEIKGNFFIKPYLEIMRLIRELEYLTFDEVKIFAVQLTDYRHFNKIKNDILAFRKEKQLNKGEYKRYLFEKWNQAIYQIYEEDIRTGKTKTRQSMDTSLKKFIATKRSTLRDYADACFRYLRYTGLVSISHRGHSISYFPDKLNEIDFILKNIERQPIFIDDLNAYKEYLFDKNLPALYIDQKSSIINTIMRISGYTKKELEFKPINELKDLLDIIVEDKRNAYIKDQVVKLKSYSLYSEVIDTYNEIISDELYDAPLILEWNTWRAMTMLNGGTIKGNFKIDDSGHPMSTAQGNMPDIECDYGSFSLAVEVTLQTGQRQYEAEGEPVARHYGKLKKRVAKETYCLFIAPTINRSTLAHFFALNKMNIDYYGGKSKIVPLELDQFMKLIENSYNFNNHPSPLHVQEFLEQVIQIAQTAKDEIDWLEKIYLCVNGWLVA